MSTTHIVIGRSAAGSLRKGLADAGRGDRVVCYGDNLALGPIDPPDPATRTAWSADHLEIDFDDMLHVMEREFAEGLRASSEPPLLWLARGCASDHMGYLEVLRRLDGRPCDVLDITDAGLFDHPAVSLLMPETFFRPEVLALRTPLVAEDRAAALVSWARLRAENAPLRVVRDGVPRSAPLDHFDAPLLAKADATWRRPAWIVGNAMIASIESDGCVSDLVLASRLEALISSGALEARGARERWSDGEVRRA